MTDIFLVVARQVQVDTIKITLAVDCMLVCKWWSSLKCTFWKTIVNPPWDLLKCCTKKKQLNRIMRCYFWQFYSFSISIRRFWCDVGLWCFVSRKNWCNSDQLFIIMFYDMKIVKISIPLCLVCGNSIWINDFFGIRRFPNNCWLEIKEYGFCVSVFYIW